jgi:hypothetical protein
MYVTTAIDPHTTNDAVLIYCTARNQHGNSEGQKAKNLRELSRGFAGALHANSREKRENTCY